MVKRRDLATVENFRVRVSTYLAIGKQGGCDKECYLNAYLIDSFMYTHMYIYVYTYIYVHVHIHILVH